MHFFSAIDSKGQAVEYRYFGLQTDDEGESSLYLYPDEEEKLVALFHSGLTPPEISDGMQRSLNSIAIRLEELGLIENRIEYLSPYIS